MAPSRITIMRPLIALKSGPAADGERAVEIQPGDSVQVMEFSPIQTQTGWPLAVSAWDCTISIHNINPCGPGKQQWNSEPMAQVGCFIRSCFVGQTRLVRSDRAFLCHTPITVALSRRQVSNRQLLICAGQKPFKERRLRTVFCFVLLLLDSCVDGIASKIQPW